MFGLGMPEILLILALALIIIGPKKLPDLAKTLGKSMREFKGAAQDFKNSINMETSITDIDPPADEIKKNIEEANKELADKKNKEGSNDEDAKNGDNELDNDTSNNTEDDLTAKKNKDSDKLKDKSSEKKLKKDPEK